jgi:hypothetical protein
LRAAAQLDRLFLVAYGLAIASSATVGSPPKKKAKECQNIKTSLKVGQKYLKKISVIIKAICLLEITWVSILHNITSSKFGLWSRAIQDLSVELKSKRDLGNFFSIQ